MSTAIKNKEELTIARIFDAPRELMWKAWTDPEHLKKWWGPKYFTAPYSMIDLRVGGRYLHAMRGPDGKDYWSTGIYREIVPLERFVCTDSFADDKGNVVPASHYGMAGDWPLELRVKVTFEDLGGRTKMTLRHEGIPAGPMLEQCEIGWSESFDKLAEYIVPVDRTRITAERGKQEVIITRVYDAPRNLVFKACTDRNLIAQWWGPKRFTTAIDKMDVRPGGVWRYVQRDAAGNTYAFHGVYHEVRSPECIIDTFEYEGAPGHVSLETLALEDLGGKTQWTARSVFQTVEDRDAMLKSGMEEGVYETMDRLAELLGKLKIERKAA
ncbi:MAG TPA: SRPBCC domain-containing protein [Nitrospirota bacterium]|nr:SRPBCC domain-containing protein [Nitrospirota bacterium]